MPISIIFSFFLMITPTSANATDLDYFKNTYEEAEQDFDRIFKQIKQKKNKAGVLEFQYSQGTIKSYFIPAATSENLLILISGTHGVEGFAGSAIQRRLLEQLPELKKTSVLTIHGFNLYGFKNKRRVNEHNIDLNRNFIIDRKDFTSDDQAYAQLNSFLNPEKAPTLNFFSRPFFILRSVANIAQHSIESLRRSILQGQYSVPQGIFYGGSQTEPQAGLVEAVIEEFIGKKFQKIFIVDLHTGYGERGRLHLMSGKSTDTNSLELLKVFEKSEIDFADAKNFYAVKGELLHYFINRLKIRSAFDTSGITFEYGTLDSQKTFGSIESLRRMILENQNFHFPADQKTSSEIQNLFVEMFYPSDPTWRSEVLRQTDEKMQKVFHYLEN